MKQLLLFLFVHLILALAIVGYTYQNSMQLQQKTLWDAVKFCMKPQIILLILACNMTFVVIYFAGVHYLHMDFWQIQLAYWATAYVGLILFWKWNNYVPTPWQWIGVIVCLIGSLIPIVGPQVFRR